MLDYAALAPIMHLEMRHIPCWNVPYIHPIRDKCSSLYENVVLGSLKSFFHLDHQVDINLYLMEATTLRHSKELVGFKPS